MMFWQRWGIPMAEQPLGRRPPTDDSFTPPIVALPTSGAATPACVSSVSRSTDDASVVIARPAFEWMKATVSRIVTASNVLCMCDRCKVVRVYASSVAAMVVQFQSFRNRTNNLLIRPSVSLLASPAGIDTAIAFPARFAVPIPAIGSRVNRPQRSITPTRTVRGSIISVCHLRSSLQDWGCAVARSVSALPGFSLGELYRA
jgi:hypothetical protein